MRKLTVEATDLPETSRSLQPLRNFVSRHKCQCGAPLVVLYEAASNLWIVRCGKDHSHTGFERVKTYAEMYRQGEALPPTIKDRLDLKLGGRINDHK